MTMMSALSSVSSGALGQYPSYGLSMRFEVTVYGLGSSTGSTLGLWQSCKGLQVELQYRKFDQGGQNLVQQWLPEKLVYGAVTLERAIEQSSSRTVQSWLAQYVNNWSSYPSSGASPLYTTVTIALLDYQLSPVMDWTLNRARPTKWIGPSLSATENKVAIETLVIEHDGFLTGLT
jgi:phage tail-like protein